LNQSWQKSWRRSIKEVSFCEFARELIRDAFVVLDPRKAQYTLPVEEYAAIYEHERKEYNSQLLLQPEDIADVIIHALSLPRTACEFAGT
jgi:NADP-dependent 3-hydroxy acid dehydrogenase YdfG